jgi:hypothetical protein
MAHCVCIGGLVIAVDVAAWVLTAETGDSRWLVLITSGTAIIVAFCTMIVMVAPHVGRAITSLGMSILPALAAIRKQNEELNKGSLSAQIDELRKSLEDKADDLADTQRKAALDLKEANQKATDALAEAHGKAAEERAEIDQRHSADLAALRKNLHDVRNQMNTDGLRREADIVDRDAQIASLKEEVRLLRMEETRLLAALAQKADVQDKRVDHVEAKADHAKATADLNARKIEAIEQAADDGGAMG